MASAEADDGGGAKNTAVIPRDRAEDLVTFLLLLYNHLTTMLQRRTHSCPACQSLFTRTWAISR